MKWRSRKEYMHWYYLDNRERLLEQHRQYYQRRKGGTVKRHLPHKKEYAARNRWKYYPGRKRKKLFKGVTNEKFAACRRIVEACSRDMVS